MTGAMWKRVSLIQQILACVKVTLDALATSLGSSPKASYAGIVNIVEPGSRRDRRNTTTKMVAVGQSRHLLMQTITLPIVLLPYEPVQEQPVGRDNEPRGYRLNTLVVCICDTFVR